MDPSTSQEAVLSKRWVAYLAKATVFLAVLFVVSRVAPMLPGWAFACVWAVLSAIVAIGAAYHAVISKTFSQKRLQEGGKAASFNNGRIVRFILEYVLSAICMGSILMEAPRWDAAMWLLLALAVPSYIGVSIIIGRQVKREFVQLARESYTALCSAVILSLLLCGVYALLMFQQPHASFSCAADAFLSTPNPFAGSPSVLVMEAGDLTTLVEGLESYVLAGALDNSLGVYVFWQVVMTWGALLGVSSVLAVCSIEQREFRRVFTDLENISEPGLHKPVKARFVVMALVLPLALVGAFAMADANAEEVMETQEVTRAQKFVRDAVNFSVFQLDGKYYDPEKVKELLTDAEAELERLAQERRDVLVPLVNASFDARIANVDKYLDWYYNPLADFEQIIAFITNNLEGFAQDKLEEMLEAGIDDSALNAEYGQLLREAEDTIVKLEKELEQYEVTQEYPDWLVTEVNSSDLKINSAISTIEANRDFVAASSRLGISGVVGFVAGVFAKKIVSRLAGKLMAKAVASRLGGAVVGGSIGMLGGPAVAAVGLLVGAAFDVALSKVDELLSREEYRQDLVASIEEEREAMLAAIA